MNFIDIIIKKKNREILTTEEIYYAVEQIGKAPDYQFSALLMAICLNGMDKRETAWYTPLEKNTDGNGALRRRSDFRSGVARLFAREST